MKHHETNFRKQAENIRSHKKQFGLHLMSNEIRSQQPSIQISSGALARNKGTSRVGTAAASRANFHINSHSLLRYSVEKKKRK